MRRIDLRKLNIPWGSLITIGVITFVFSLIVDVLMGKPLDYFYAFILSAIFAAIFFALQYLINYRMRVLRSRLV